MYVCMYAIINLFLCLYVVRVYVWSQFERTHKYTFVFFVRVFLFHKYIFVWLKYKCALSVSVLSGLRECAEWFVCMSVLSGMTEACAHNVRSQFERTHKYTFCFFFGFTDTIFLAQMQMCMKP